jgi:hypothetical protein
MLCALLLPLASLSLAPPPGLVEMDLFTPAMNDTAGMSYNCFRIPSMVWVASNSAALHGVLLAFAEGRRLSCNDRGDVRIVMRRSDDGGAHWSAIEQVQVESGHTIGNPAPVADLTAPGSVHLVFARDDNQLFVSSSLDFGATWSRRRNLTRALKANPQPEAEVMSGPPGGVQLLPSGRMIVGIYGADRDGQIRSYAGFSDDHGKTWGHGAPAGTFTTGPVYGGGENQIVQYGSDGTLAMFLRGRTLLPSINEEDRRISSDTGGGQGQGGGRWRSPQDVSHNHGLAWSSDGGATWSNASRLNITGSYCEGSVARTAQGGLLLSAPSTLNGGRYNLTLWHLAPGATPGTPGSLSLEYYATLHSGWASYSSMLGGTSDDEFLNLYEAGPGHGYAVSALTLARFVFRPSAGGRKPHP